MGGGLMDRWGRPVPARTAHTLGAWARGARRGGLARREFLSLASTFGLGAAASYGLLRLGGSARAQEPIPDPAGMERPGAGGVLRIAMNVRPLRDPRLFDWQESAEIARQFCEPLVRYRSDGLLEPWLLRSWETSPDASAYVFRLRAGAGWTNGDPFTAADVVANFRRWCDRSVVGNSMADRLGALIDPNSGQLASGAIEVLDDHTLRLKLLRPDVTLIAALTDYPALLVHRDFDKTGDDLAAAPIGTGPFELVAYEEGVRAALKRRENGPWWGGDAYLDGILFRDLGESGSAEAAAAQEAAFAAGEIDLTYETPPERRAAIEALGFEPLEIESADTVVIRANAAAEPFTDPRVAKAFQLAVDPQAIIDAALPGDATPAEHHHVWTGHPEYAPGPAPTRDLAGAKALLQEAGRAGLAVDLISVDDDLRRRTADVAAEQIRETGADVNRVVLPSRIYWADWRTHPFSITPWRMRPLAAQTLALAYRSDAAWNESGYADPVFDALLDVAVEVADLDARRVVMRRLQRRLQSSGAIIQPYWRTVRRHRAPNVRGAPAHPMLELHLESAYLVAS